MFRNLNCVLIEKSAGKLNSYNLSLCAFHNNKVNSLVSVMNYYAYLFPCSEFKFSSALWNEFKFKVIIFLYSKICKI